MSSCYVTSRIVDVISYAENVTFHMQALSAHEMGVIEDMEDITADIVDDTAWIVA